MSAQPGSSLGGRSPSADSNLALHINVLGVLQFGLTPTLELGGENLSFSARFRAMQTGFLGHRVIADPAEDEALKFSWGLGGLVRYYPRPAGGNMRGWFLGGGLELVKVRIEDSVDDLERYDSTALVPELEAGHRWVFGNFLVDVGATLGVGLVTSATTTSLRTRLERPTEDAGNGALFGHFVVGLGWFL